MVDETVSRRFGFRDGPSIRMADGRTWTMPAPLTASEWKRTPFGTEYANLMRSIKEAEDRDEQRLAELGFAIFLLGHNYCLTSADYERLLGFTPGSADLQEWQSAFRRITHEHLESLEDCPYVPVDHRPILPRPRRFFRLLAWVRDHLPSRWWSIDSRMS